MAGALVGKASGRFSSLKSIFRRHGVTPETRDGAFTARLAPGAGSVDAWKQEQSLIFRDNNAKSAASGHTPVEPGLTDFNNGVWTGWVEIRDEEDSFMQG